MSWKKYANQTPSEDGEYLTVSLYNNGQIKTYAVHSWANNLRDHSWDFDDEEYEHSGFYDYDPEWWGAYEVPNVEAWMEIEEYEYER